jgi:hypothetical protein
MIVSLMQWPKAEASDPGRHWFNLLEQVGWDNTYREV